MSLPRLAVRRPVTTSMLFVAITLLGLFSVNRLAIDLIPEISLSSLSISTSYSGVAPEEIETLITIPIEQAVATIKGVTGMQSVSSEGNSRVTLQFRHGIDLDAAAAEVRAAVEGVRGRLPSGASAPRVVQFDPNQSPIMTIGIGGDLDPAELRRLAEETFIFELERIDGVGSVTLQGGRQREVRVILDPVRLQGHGLTIDQVAQAIQAENLNVPAGRVLVGQAQYTLRTRGRLEGLSSLENVMVANRDGVQTRLGDIAEIVSTADQADVIVRVDGRPGAVLSVQKQSGANTVRVADAVMKTLEDLRRRHPELTIRPVSDSSTFIRLAVRNVIQSGLYGGLLAALILLVFLRSLRTTLIIAVSIPVSIVASFILIERAGMTLNTMSLGGLALGIGMLVDNAIVVLENVYRLRRQGMSVEEAAIVGTEEMAPAIIASTLTTLAVFLPMLFITGTSGILFRQLALMVAFSITCSLFVALTLIPVMCARMMRAGESARAETAAHAGETGRVGEAAQIEEAGHAGELRRAGLLGRLDGWLERAFARQENAYAGLLERAMKRPGLVCLTSVALFAGSLALVPYLGTEFLPPTDEGEISISVSLPEGTRLENTDQMVQRIEEIVRSEVPELQAMEARVGGGGTHSGNVSLTLVPRGERERTTAEVVAALRESISKIPGITYRVNARSNFAARLASGNFGGGGGERISLSVQGHDLQQIRAVADDLRQLISQVPGITDVSVARSQSQPEFVIRVDRERAAAFGLSTTQVANAVQTAMQGRVATRMQIDGSEFQVRVVLAGVDRLTAAEVEALPIPVGGGNYIPLSSVGYLVQQQSPTAIERYDQQRTVRLTASPEGRDLGSAVAAIRSAVETYPLPPGVTLRFGGEYEEQQRAFREMLMVLGLAVSLVFIVMASQFESFLHPLIVMFSVPFAIVGVVLALLLTATPLNTQAFMGLIMLGGVVVNNAIVLVTYINLLRERGVPLDEAVVRGGRSRLRPIVMTTGTTVLGLLPLALQMGEGAEMQAPLAMTVIGGLLVSTLVTLVLIPTIYRWVEQRKERRGRAVQPVRESADGRGRAAMRSAGATASTVALWLAFGTLAFTAPARAEAAEQRITLAEAVQIAARSSPVIAAADLALEEARLAYDEAMAELIARPSVIARQQAENAWEAAQHTRRLAQQDLILQVTQAYFEVLRSEMALELSRSALEQAQAQLETNRLRRAQGLLSDIDVLAAEAQVITAELELNRARANETSARIALNRLLGLGPEASLELAGELRTERVEVDLDAAIATALAERLELRRARALVELRELELSAAELETPLAERRARLAVERARLELAEREMDVILEVRQNHQAVVEAEARIPIQEKNLARAAESLRITQLRHDAGLVTAINVIEAQRAAFQAEMQLIQAEFDYRIALARFYRSAGVPMEEILDDMRL